MLRICWCFLSTMPFCSGISAIVVRPDQTDRSDREPAVHPIRVPPYNRSAKNKVGNREPSWNRRNRRFAGFQRSKKIGTSDDLDLRLVTEMMGDKKQREQNASENEEEAKCANENLKTRL